MRYERCAQNASGPLSDLEIFELGACAELACFQICKLLYIEYSNILYIEYNISVQRTGILEHFEKLNKLE